MSETSYQRLGKLLQAKVENHARGITFLEAGTASGHTFELWATIEDNEVDTRFFMVAPGMRVLHVYLSDFQELLHAKDKVVVDVSEGVVFGQASYMFKILIANIEQQFRTSLNQDSHALDEIAYRPMDALIQTLQLLRRTYRYVVLIDGQLVSGEAIKPKELSPNS